jgi:hypothetical protein
MFLLFHFIVPHSWPSLIEWCLHIFVFQLVEYLSLSTNVRDILPLFKVLLLLLLFSFCSCNCIDHFQFLNNFRHFNSWLAPPSLLTCSSFYYYHSLNIVLDFKGTLPASHQSLSPTDDIFQESTKGELPKQVPKKKPKSSSHWKGN